MNLMRIATAAVLAGAMLAGPASSRAKRNWPVVTISFTSHDYHPNPIYLAGGVPTRIIFQNRSGKTHDFKAPMFFRNARMLGGAAPGGVIRLARGGAAVIDLVPRRGHYKVHCTQPFHTMLGMTGRIIVA